MELKTTRKTKSHPAKPLTRFPGNIDELVISSGSTSLPMMKSPETLKQHGAEDQGFAS